MEGLLLDNDFAEEEDKPYVRLYIKRDGETIAALDPNFETYLYVVADQPDQFLKLMKTSRHKWAKYVNGSSK